MFMGEYNHSLDAKGRTIVPAKLREEIGETFVITRGLDGCLFGYSETEWADFEQKIKALPTTTSKAAREMVRYFLSGATQCEFDKQGRVLVPANLREFAKLEKDIVFVGSGTRIEIWSKAKWDEINSSFEGGVEGLFEELGENGFNI